MGMIFFLWFIKQLGVSLLEKVNGHGNSYTMSIFIVSPSLRVKLGEKGKHARSAVGMYALPMNIAVEVEVIVEVEN